MESKQPGGQTERNAETKQERACYGMEKLDTKQLREGYPQRQMGMGQTGGPRRTGMQAKTEMLGAGSRVKNLDRMSGRDSPETDSWTSLRECGKTPREREQDKSNHGG